MSNEPSSELLAEMMSAMSEYANEDFIELDNAAKVAYLAVMSHPPMWLVLAVRNLHHSCGRNDPENGIRWRNDGHTDTCMDVPYVLRLAAGVTT